MHIQTGYALVSFAEYILLCIDNIVLTCVSTFITTQSYITNTNLEAKRVIEEYHGLWVVERLFRISKGTLELRPMFHFTKRRIEAHVCICFIAYKVYKELERQILLSKIDLSVDHVLDIAKTITTIRIWMPKNQTFYTKTLFLTKKQLVIKPLFDNIGGKS